MQVNVATNSGPTAVVHVAQQSDQTPAVHVQSDNTPPQAGAAATLQPTTIPTPGVVAPSIRARSAVVLPIILTPTPTASPTATPTVAPTTTLAARAPVGNTNPFAAMWRFLVSLF